MSIVEKLKQDTKSKEICNLKEFVDAITPYFPELSNEENIERNSHLGKFLYAVKNGLYSSARSIAEINNYHSSVKSILSNYEVNNRLGSYGFRGFEYGFSGSLEGQY